MTENPYQSPKSESAKRGVPSRASLDVFVASIAIPIAAELLLLWFLDRLPRFTWLGGQALLPVYPGVLALAIWAASRPVATPRLMWLSPLLILPNTMITWAVIYENMTAPPIRHPWPAEEVLACAFLASLPLSVVAIYANRGQRWLVAAIAILAVICCLSSLFIGSMAITGDWI